MLSGIKRIVEFYVYSNLHIALCAAVYVLGASHLATSQYQGEYMIPVLAGIATLLVYNAHRLIGHYRLTDINAPKRIRFVRRYWIILSVIVLCSLVWAFLVLDIISIQVWYFLIPSIILTGLYVFPLLPGKRRLRDLPFIKIVIIAIVWAGVFIIPLLSSKSDYLHQQYLMIILEKMFFFLMITIPFDYRDRDIDIDYGTSTVATALSTKSLKALITIAGVATFLLVSVLYTVGIYSLPTSVALVFFYIISVALSINGIKRQEEMYYLGILDGLILLNGFCYLITIS